MLVKEPRPMYVPYLQKKANLFAKWHFFHLVPLTSDLKLLLCYEYTHLIQILRHLFRMYKKILMLGYKHYYI